jgi:hypothetical protein
VRVASAHLPKPAQLAATVDGYSCVGTEVRGTKDRRRVEYFVYSMDSHRDTYERHGYSLTLVQTGIPPALRELRQDRRSYFGHLTYHLATALFFTGCRFHELARLTCGLG